MHRVATAVFVVECRSKARKNIYAGGGIAIPDSIDDVVALSIDVCIDLVGDL